MSIFHSKKAFKRICCGGLALVILSAGISTAAFSFSWFHNNNYLSNKQIKGSTAGAYFARGTGTKDDPYVINRPIHLYNLAWLQDIGYFDDVETYFIIEKDLDMTGWVTPPIGTNDHPFIGHLDGCDNDEKTGHAKDQDRTAIVSNLTVSNNFNDFTRHPSKVTSLGNANTVGFFGTFGKEGESYADGAEPTAKNLYLDNLTVKTNSSNTLVGMAAGYVNGTLDAIGIADSKINVGSSSSSYGSYTSNLSDYTTVGYAEEKYRVNAYEKKISTKASDLEFSQESEGSGGSSAGNGGSIDMNTMYTNLLTIYNNSTDVKTATAETITYDINGNIVDDDITSTSTYSNIKVSEQTYDYENESLTSASYSFRGTFNNGIYIYGKESGTISSQTKAVTEIRPTKFYYKTIADSTSSNYLSVSNGSVANATTGTSSYWFFDGNSLSLETNGTTYYLCNSSGTLTVTTYETYATNWAYNEDGATYVSDDGYYLTYDSGWTLKRASYKVSGTYNNSTYYLTNSGTSLTITSSQSSAATWLLDSSNRLYTTINGSTYYLTYSSSSSGWSQSYSPTLSKSYDNALTYDTSGGTFSVSLSEWWSTTTYYLYITSSGVSLILIPKQRLLYLQATYTQD